MIIKFVLKWILYPSPWCDLTCDLLCPMLTSLIPVLSCNITVLFDLLTYLSCVELALLPMEFWSLENGLFEICFKLSWSWILSFLPGWCQVIKMPLAIMHLECPTHLGIAHIMVCWWFNWNAYLMQWPWVFEGKLWMSMIVNNNASLAVLCLHAYLLPAHSAVTKSTVHVIFIMTLPAKFLLFTALVNWALLKSTYYYYQKNQKSHNIL